jgi:A/G-specific adenine glycosylase
MLAVTAALERTPHVSMHGSAPDLVRLLLAWYDRERRDLPWRAPPGARPDPYRVWISEIMLQQTTVAAVKPYFAEFMVRWPTVAALADASLAEVLHAWQGLGYYARARHLHACARHVAEAYAGRFPDTEAGLRQLPGIGAYTAAAVAAIAFGRKAVPVDGNVLRIVARLFVVDTPLPAARPVIARLAQTLAPDRRAGDVAQALMDLGSTVCTPRRPACAVCPLSDACQAAASGHAEHWPRRTAKPHRPHRYGVAFWIERRDGMVLLRRRPLSGLLGGMMEVPSTEWRADAWTAADAAAAAPLAAVWRAVPGRVEHVFTHFRLSLSVLAGTVAEDEAADGLWWPVARLGEQALPTVMKKVVRVALAATDAAGRY